jgi:hypothetical protein
MPAHADARIRTEETTLLRSMPAWTSELKERPLLRSRPATALRSTRAMLAPVLGRSGDPSEEPKPDPISNSAVKLPSAHGTVSQDTGESVIAGPAKNRIRTQNPLYSSSRKPCPSRGFFRFSAHRVSQSAVGPASFHNSERTSLLRAALVVAALACKHEIVRA